MKALKAISALKAFLPVLLALLPCIPAFGDSRSLKPLDALIAGAESIAIVNAGMNKQVLREPGKTVIYGVATPVTLVETLKGTLPAEFSIHHSSSRADRLFFHGPGQYLVFLKTEGDQPVPANAADSSKVIRNGKVVGWNDNHSDRQEPVDLEQVKRQIAETLGR